MPILSENIGLVARVRKISRTDKTQSLASCNLNLGPIDFAPHGSVDFVGGYTFGDGRCAGSPIPSPSARPKGVLLPSYGSYLRSGSMSLRILATTVKCGSTTFAMSYSIACPSSRDEPRSSKP